jgi:hypothetical protein
VRFDEPDIIAPDDEWGRRRANMRHEVSIPAVITDRLGNRIKCTIEDISATGMLLAIDMAQMREIFADERNRELLKQGSTAHIAFAPDPIAAPHERIGVSVHIMWRAPVAAGVRFLEQTPELRAALLSIARTAVAARIDETERTRHDLSPAQRETMRACRKTVQKLLPNMIWAMRTELGKRLRLPSEHPHATEAEAAREEADRLEVKAMAVTRTIEQQVLQGFSEASELEQTQELTLAQLQSTWSGQRQKGADLGMVEELELEQDARVSAVAYTIEERYKTKFFELNVRLANVLGHPLDQHSNPLVPGAICRIFWHAVTAYCDSPRIQKALQQVMLQAVGPLIGELYAAINATLDDHGAQRIFDIRQDDRLIPR